VRVRAQLDSIGSRKRATSRFALHASVGMLGYRSQ
jgi:hypothetical protein